MASGFTVVAGKFGGEDGMKVRGQAALIVAAMSATEPRTTKQIADAIREKLETRQDPERVVGYYMTVWKKKGLVRSQDVTVAADEEEDDEDDEEEEEEEEEDEEEDGEEIGGINQADAASTGATQEERMEAAAEADLHVSAIEVREGMKMSEAVLATLHSVQSADVDTIVEKLNGFGYAAKKEQVRGALTNLIRRNVVGEAAPGLYEARGNQ